MSDLITEQFRRLLSGLPSEDPWPVLEASGYLDLFRREEDGGAGLSLEDCFPIALEAGRWAGSAGVIETMAARIVLPTAVRVLDAEQALAEADIDANVARALAAALVSTQMAGAMAKVLEMTLAYASIRSQFGRPIGKFQAVQHQIAVMAEEEMAARMAAQAAMVGSPLDISWPRAGVAKARAGQAAQVICAMAHAVHGAIGVSQEHGLHHLTMRLHLWSRAHGGELYWARRLGEAALEKSGGLVDVARGL